jgi:hypothetical protein
MRAQALWLCLALGVVSVGAYVSHRGAVSSGEAVEGDLVEYVPDPEYARLLALGHTPSLADVFWVRGVLYFGQGIQSKQKEGRFRWLASYIDVVVELDPDFESIYQWGGAAVIFSQPEVTVEQVRLANEILEAGAARFPGIIDFCCQRRRTVSFIFDQKMWR